MARSERERVLDADLACANHHLLILLEQEMNPWLRVAQAARLAPEYLHRAVWRAKRQVLSLRDLAALCYATVEGLRLETGFLPESGPGLERRVRALGEECSLLLRRFRRLRLRDPEAAAVRRDQLVLAATAVTEYRNLPSQWWRAAVIYSLTPESRARPWPGRRPAPGQMRLIPLLSQSLIRVAAMAERDPAHGREPAGQVGVREALAWDLAARVEALPDRLLLHAMRRMEWGVPPADALHGLDPNAMGLHRHEPPDEKSPVQSQTSVGVALPPTPCQ